MRSQSRSLVPLFKLVDKVTRVKKSMDDTLKISGAIDVLDDDVDASHSGCGKIDVHAV